jgi:hypothetical protein
LVIRQINATSEAGMAGVVDTSEKFLTGDNDTGK